MTNDIYGSFKTRKHDFIAGIKLVKKSLAEMKSIT